MQRTGLRTSQDLRSNSEKKIDEYSETRSFHSFVGVSGALWNGP